MSRALPATIGPDVLPRPELRALVLDGVLWPLDRTFHAVDEPDRPGLRADALFRSFLVDLSRRRGPASTSSLAQRIVASGALSAFVASGLSAAWVHGAIVNPPRVHEVLARAPARVPVPSLPSDWHVSQAHVREADVCLRAGWPVLTETATARALAMSLTGSRDRARADGAASVGVGERGVETTGASTACGPSIRMAALVRMVRLIGLDTIRASLETAHPRRGTRAHDAAELITRVVGNLAADDLRAAERERERVLERACERKRELERELERERERQLEQERKLERERERKRESKLERERKRQLENGREQERERRRRLELHEEQPRLTEQKRLTPLPDPRRRVAVATAPQEDHRPE